MTALPAIRLAARLPGCFLLFLWLAAAPASAAQEPETDAEALESTVPEPPENVEESPAAPAEEPEPEPESEPEPEAIRVGPDDPVAASAPPLELAPPREDLDDRFNQRRVPAGREDLLAIQTAIQNVMPAAIKALVCIEVGGGSGSGAIVTPSGLILSAAHVTMQPGTKLTVRLADGREVKAETLGLVPETDAGMARILDEGTYDWVPLGDYASLKLGHWCFALGHSGGWDEARGPVVRTGRIIRLKDGTMQSDCKLIGGDSGGPVFDLHGRLIGINSRVGMNVEQSLHCPANVFIDNDAAMRRGIVIDQEHPAFLGAVTSDFEGGGVELGDLLKDGPAERAGLKKGDVLLAAGGEALADKAALTRALAPLKAGERLLLTIRSGTAEPRDEWVRTGSKDGFKIMGL
jgi:serine protease Do